MELNRISGVFKPLIKKLKIPTPLPLIKHRIISGRDGEDKKIDYVEWYNYAEALDNLCQDSWSVEILSVTEAQKNVCVAVRLYIDGHTIDNIGSESTNHTDPAAAAWAQAFKRCCATLGLTRDLYSKNDVKAGLWKMVEATRLNNIKEIEGLLKTVKVPIKVSKLIKDLISDGSMHYNASVRTLEHLNGLELIKPKSRKVRKASEKSSVKEDEVKTDSSNENKKLKENPQSEPEAQHQQSAV